MTRWSGSPAVPVEALGRPAKVRGTTAGPEPTGADPVSMAMHLHASFSEDTASYEAHLAEARRLGVDVLWWTDHDFRVSAQGYRQAVRFDGPEEPEGGPEFVWTWSEEREGALLTGGHEFTAEPHSPDEPGTAMRLYATSAESGSGALWCRGEAWNQRYSTSLADTTLELDVLLEELGDDGALLLEVQLSHHPSAADRPAGIYKLHYTLGQFSRRRHFTDGDGLLGVVEQPAPKGQWYRLRAKPVDDIAALWPDLVAADNALSRLRMGVRSRAGAPVRAVVDRLRFHRAERAEGDSLALRRKVLDSYATRFTGLRHFESLEVSLVRHLNWFGGELSMPDYSASTVHDWSVDSARSMVDFIHEHGGLVSFNHPLTGMYTDGDPLQLAELILRTNALGADIVEIGHKEDLDALLHVFDVAARNAVLFTGTGVSDDHLAEDWINQPLNYLTHVWSDSLELADLMQSLRGGRAWFADPAAWRGTLDLEVMGAPAMGGVVHSDKDRLPISAIATDLPTDGHLELISGPVDRPGTRELRPTTSSRPVPARQLRRGRFEFDLDLGPSGSYVRAQVRDSSGNIVGVGNPTWLLPESSGIETPHSRRIVLEDP